VLWCVAPALERLVGTRATLVAVLAGVVLGPVVPPPGRRRTSVG
jgi:hypothetical protein